MKAKIILASAISLSAIPLLAQAQAQHAHSSQNHDRTATGQRQTMRNTAPNPYAEAEQRMHERMMKAMGAGPDETWARKMIEHHRGAIEMGRILVTNGADAGLKRMTHRSMAEQQSEIDSLQAWLKQKRKHAQ